MTEEPSPPPTPAAAVPKHVWPLDLVVHAAFDGYGLPALTRFQLGLQRVESYVHAAVVQASRLNSTIVELRTRLQVVDLELVSNYPRWRLVSDAHFYFVCWDSVAKAIYSLRQNPARLTAPRRVWQRYRPTLEKYQRARDHLEHYVERLPMGRHDKWKHERNDKIETLEGDAGTVLLGGVFSINGEGWDVSPSSAQPLQSLWRDLEAEIRSETSDWVAAYMQGQRRSRSPEVPDQ